MRFDLIFVHTGTQMSKVFIDHPDEKAKRWLGRFYTKESVKEETGIENVEYLEKFEESRLWR